MLNDVDSGCCYYVNRVTGESQWEAPEEVSALWEGHDAPKPHGLERNTLSSMAGVDHSCG